MKQYLLYVLRWAVLGIPGAWVFQAFSQHFSFFYAMIISQTLLGMVVYFIDRKIFGGIK